MQRRNFLLSAGALAVSAGASTNARAQAWPSRPIKVLVGFAPGGGLDTLARLLIEPMGRELGQTLIVENKPGAAAALATAELLRSANDGYTIMLSNVGALSVQEHIAKSPVPDLPAKVAPIGQIGTAYLGLFVPADSPAKTAQEFLALLKANPGKYSYGSGGAGQVTHLAVELLKLDAGVQITHVPYKGSAAVVTDLIGGHIAAMIDVLGLGDPHVKTGKLRLLAVTAPQRLADHPDTPTLAEVGVPGYVVGGWQGMVAPLGTPQPVIDKLNAALNSALKSPAVAERMVSFGYIPAPGTPADFAKLMRDDSKRWGRVIKDAKIVAG